MAFFLFKLSFPGLFSSADSNYNNAIINTNVIVSPNGNVKWLSHGIFKSSCDISVEYFPFDVQVCKMKWASWTYDGLAVSLATIIGFSSVFCSLAVN